MKVLVYGATGSQQSHVIGAAKNKGSNVFAVTSSEKHFSRLQEAGATRIPAVIYYHSKWAYRVKI